MKRNKNMTLIFSLSFLLFLFIIVEAFRHIRIYLIYSSGLGPFITAGILFSAIIILFFRSL